MPSMYPGGYPSCYVPGWVSLLLYHAGYVWCTMLGMYGVYHAGYVQGVPQGGGRAYTGWWVYLRVG